MSGHTPYLSPVPHPALAPYVTSLVAYDVAMGPPGVHRGLPSTALTFVLPVDEPLDVGWSDDPSSRRRRWSVLSGLHVGPASIHHDGHQSGIQLGLTPAGARVLLGVPSAALCHQLVEVDDLDGRMGAPQLHQLPERLHSTTDQLERLRLTHEALLSAVIRQQAPGLRPEVGQAMASLARGVRVHAVADQVGWSRRHLAAQFRAELGLGPKAYQRVARFQVSCRLLLSAALRGRPSVAAVAVDAGYADQAHLTREWVDLAGCTPVRWLSEEFPFLQDSVPGPREAGRDGERSRHHDEERTPR